MIDLIGLRRDYTAAGLMEDAAGNDPFVLFDTWLHQAVEACQLDPNAMTLSTCVGGKPSSRIVLLKGFDSRGFVFFTNYESRKGRELGLNPEACVLFFWPELERQVRIDGTVEKTSRQESEDYFRIRPLESRISACASEQSTIIPDRNFLESRAKEVQERFGNNPPVPDAWGGYRLKPLNFEFWQGRPARLHDRIQFVCTDPQSPQIPRRWLRQRLSP